MGTLQSFCRRRKNDEIFCFQLLLHSYLLSSMIMMMCLLLLEDCQTNGNDDLFDILPKNIVWQAAAAVLHNDEDKASFGWDFSRAVADGWCSLVLPPSQAHTICRWSLRFSLCYSTKQCVQLGQNQVVQSYYKLFQEVKKITMAIICTTTVKKVPGIVASLLHPTWNVQSFQA